MVNDKNDNQPTKIAFFDIDNTLIRGSSLYYLGLGAFAKKLIRLSDVTSFIIKNISFRTVGENNQHMHQVKERALGLLSGIPVTTIEELCEEIVKTKIRRRFYADACELVEQHLASGGQVWMASATPEPIANALRKAIAVDGVISTELESVEGIYTGNLVTHISHGRYKAELAKKVIAESGVDPKDCWVYSDSHNDIPLMNAVGHPVAVNPDKPLARYAKARGWPILKFSKLKKL